MKIAYLCCTATHPDSTERTTYAPEHDLMTATYRAALSSVYEGDLVEISWDTPDVDWGDYDVVLLGSVWDYADHQDAFLATMDQIANATRIYNDPDLLRWNSRKTYLQDLAARDIPTVPSCWLDTPSADAVNATYDILKTDQIVVKRQVGAGAIGQHRLRKGDPVPAMDSPMIVQPFLETIKTEGEYSFIFIDGALSHAIQKHAKPGDYRIQAAYGGVETGYDATADELEAATAVLAALDDLPLYARVDMVRAEDGSLMLMELEAIEPYLFPKLGPQVGPMMIDGLKRRLAQ